MSLDLGLMNGNAGCNFSRTQARDPYGDTNSLDCREDRGLYCADLETEKGRAPFRLKRASLVPGNRPVGFDPARETHIRISEKAVAWIGCRSRRGDDKALATSASGAAGRRGRCRLASRSPCTAPPAVEVVTRRSSSRRKGRVEAPQQRGVARNTSRGQRRRTLSHRSAAEPVQLRRDTPLVCPAPRGNASIGCTRSVWTVLEAGAHGRRGFRFLIDLRPDAEEERRAVVLAQGLGGRLERNPAHAVPLHPAPGQSRDLRLEHPAGTGLRGAYRCRRAACVLPP